MSVISDQLEATPQAAPTTQPDEAICQCANCNSESHSYTTASADGPVTTCPDDAEFLVERSGFSCANCLPMMVGVGLAMIEDEVDFGPDAPVHVGVTEYHPGAPLFIDR